MRKMVKHLLKKYKYPSEFLYPLSGVCGEVETMRKLTFEGFLKQYVAELSGVQTASIHKLADRVWLKIPA